VFSPRVRVLVIGQNPSNQRTNRVWFGRNHTTTRLNEWMSVIDVRYYSFFNVAAFSGDYKDSLHDAKWIAEAVEGYDRIVALGNIASETLRKCGIKHHKIPHPSSRNRLFNEPCFEYEAVKALGDYVYD